MQANRSKTWLVALSTAFLAGCGYSPMPLQPGMDTGTIYGNSSGYISQNAPPVLPPGVQARSLSLDPANANGRVGESMRFTVAIKGSDGKIYSDPRLVLWSLSNPQMGTIDQNGVLVPQMSGTVKIVASIAGMNAEASVQVAEARFAWQQMISPTGADLHAVKMLDRNDAWAAGDHGTMLRFINGAWHPEPTFRFPDADLRGLGFANVNLGWAVGSRHNGDAPFIGRWNGMAWVGENLPVSDGQLNAISVLNDHDVWAVGQEGNGDSLILHFDGFNWKQMESPAKGKLNGIQMLSPRHGWAVGKSGGISTIPLILEYVDGSWKKNGLWDNRGSISLTSTPELTGIKMVSETQGYAVGISHVPLLKPRGLFLTYDPKRNGWTPGQYDSKNPDLPQVPLYAIDMISGTEGWALGEVRQPDFTLERNPKSIFGNLLANEGGVLRMDTNYFSGNLNGSFYAIDLLPQGDGFVVGQSGFILQRTYDWRGVNNGTNGGYGSTYGTNGNGGMMVNPAGATYGPGGAQVPGTALPHPY